MNDEGSLIAMHENKRSAREKTERHRSGGGVIRDLVYGAHDGIITTFAVVAGAAGASLEASIVLIMGFANLIADGISMGLGNFLGTKSEQRFIHSERETERRHVEERPEDEREELRAIYREQGFDGELLERVVEVVTANKERWVDTMIHGELRLRDEGDLRPARNGALTFFAFVAAGFIPLIAYLLPAIGDHSFLAATALAALALFSIGAARILVTGGSALRAGMEMLGVGAFAAAAAYLIGAFVGGLVG